MEITLEKIELVKDRTGVSYKEAKEALEAAEGSVVDAIIAIEETIDVKKTNKAGVLAMDTVDKVKELVKKGNISKIAVKKDEETVVNIPVNVGVVGALVAPWGVLAAAIAAFGFKCKIELTTDEGKVIDISEKAENAANDIKEKSSVVIDEVVAKGTVVVNNVKEKAPDAWEDIKAKSTEAYTNIKEAAEAKIELMKNKGEESFDDFEAVFDEIIGGLEETAEEAKAAVEEKIDEIEEKIEEKTEE
ncbi:MAG: DUF4342 domain-containing protein [Firmicutes bacterium]|nr:DUF4342 domain-containing protein [Bacillota bacterium]